MKKKTIIDVGFGRHTMYDLYKSTEMSSRLQYGLVQLEDKYEITRVSLEKPTLYGTLQNNYKCLESCDVLYMTYFYPQPLILLSLLRYIGLYRRRKIVVICHVSLVDGRNFVEKIMLRCIYRTIDCFLFHSQKNMDESIEKGLINSKHAEFLCWGDDLDYIDSHFKPVQRDFFLSTGREHRDYLMLISAFSQTTAVLELYTNRINIFRNYEYLETIQGKYPNIHIYFVDKRPETAHRLTKRTSESFCVVISLIQEEVSYCLGLTSVIEAMALGKPIISSRNPYCPIDIEKEGIGIIADDEESWINAINYLYSHPDEAKQMGMRARRLAEQKYNIKECAKQIDRIFSTPRY